MALAVPYISTGAISLIYKGTIVKFIPIANPVNNLPRIIISVLLIRSGIVNNIVSISDRIIVFFLPSLVVITPAINAPNATPGVYNDYNKPIFKFLFSQSHSNYTFNISNKQFITTKQ